MSWLLPLLSLGVGYFAWRNAAFLPLALMFPVLWFHSKTRFIAWLCSLCYYLAASRGLPQGAANFFEASFFSGILLWLAANVILSIPWLFLWKSNNKGKYLNLFLIFYLISLPPVAIVGWAHPLSGAGLIFEGWAWWGLLAMCLMQGLLIRFWFINGFLLIATLIIPTTVLAPVPAPVGWLGISTSFDFNTGSHDFMKDFDRQLRLQEIVRQNKGPQVLVFPESSAGRWNDAARSLWRPVQVQLEDQSLLLGAELLLPNGQYENLLIELQANEERIIYQQRMPVPFSMWQPWNERGAIAHWFDNPIATIRDKKAAILICYEQFLIWPVLHSMLYEPDVIIAVANNWWARGTSIPDIQQALMVSWSRLFGVGVVEARNR